MRVAVAGAGVGGLTAALALAERGAEVVVCERAPWLEEAGAGVQLGPNAVRVLDGLGLGPALRAAAFAPEAAEVRDAASGRILLRTALGAAAERRWGAPYLQIHRADLQRVLLHAALARPGVNLRLDRPVVGVDPDGRLHLAGGEAVEADVVVGADGLRSAVAASLWGAEAPRFTGWSAWRALVPREAVAAEVPPAAAVWVGRGRHLVHYPVRGGAWVNLVAVTAAGAGRTEAWTASGDPAELRAAFAGWPEPVPALLAQVEACARWALFDRPTRPAWSRGRATLLGDAAHPMLPYLAQGAAMAVEDAAVLAASLAAAPADPAQALRAYEAARRPRTAQVAAWSRANGRLFHLPPPAARLAFAAAGAVGAPERRLDALYGWTPP